MFKNDVVGVGVIGAGEIGAVHSENLARRTRRARVTAVMDVDGERAEAVASACGARAYTDAAALIADPAVDALLVATPDATHADLTIAAIEAGKPALCEKPLATTAADAQRVLRAELAAGRRMTQVGFMRIYDRSHVEVRRLLRRGDIGRALRFRGMHINPYRGVTTIDRVMVNSLIHDIHSARWIMDAEVESVFARWVPAQPDEPRSARFASVLMTFEGGAIGSMDWSGNSNYGYEVTMEITGETGTAGTVSHTSPILRQGSRISQAVTPNWPERFADAYIDEAQIWIDSILSGQPTGPSAWDGYMSLVVAEACIRSTQTGQPEMPQSIKRPAIY